MEMKKRIPALLLALCMLLPLSAAAEKEDLTGRPIADGYVAAASFVDVTAPFSGTLTSFDLAAGDTVEAGQTLMGFVTTDLYATESGKLSALFADVGDDAQAVTNRYGGVLGIEPAHTLLLNATTSGAGSDEECKRLHLGETLYFKTAGKGRVVAVSGETYQVEVLEGNCDLGDSVNLYRSDSYSSSLCVGKGTAARRDDALAQAQGRVVAVYAAEGDSVTKGDKLMSLVAADAAPDAHSADVVSPAAGVIANVAVQPGQQVAKGMLLCRVYLTAEIEAVAEVDEMDLGDLRVGDAIPVVLDVSDSVVLSGTVTEISALGTTKLNAAYFTVHVALPVGSGKLGASASVYLPAKN